MTDLPPLPVASVKLYAMSAERALRPRWLLEELAVPYTMPGVVVRSDGIHDAATHPFGVIPALVDGARTVLEAAAICMHLAEKHVDKGLVPPKQSAERERYYGVIRHGVAVLEPIVEPVWQRALRGPAELRRTTATTRERERFAAQVAPVDALLASQDYIVGTTFSAADVVVGGLLHQAEQVGLLVSDGPLVAYVVRLRSRPAFGRATT